MLKSFCKAVLLLKDGSTPKRYDFLEIHIDSIIIMHPASQTLFKESSKVQEDIAKFRELRNRLSQTKPF